MLFRSAEIADKFTRNEIMTSNEIRQVIGMRPSSDPKADELVNSNISQPNEGGLNGQNPTTDQSSVEESEEDFIVNDLLNSLEDQINSIIDGYLSEGEEGEVVDDDG